MFVGTAIVSWFAAGVALRLWPSPVGAVTALVMVTVAILALLFVMSDVVSEALDVRRLGAAAFVAASLCVVIFGEFVFTFGATQSYSAADRTILPLGTAGFINDFGSFLFLASLFAAPCYQFRTKRKTQVGWNAVDNRIIAWAPRLCAGSVSLITLLYHYWGGPLATTPLPFLAVGSLSAAVLLPPVLRSVVTRIVRDGPESLIGAPRRWFSTVMEEFGAEAQAVGARNWDDALATYRSTIVHFGSPDSATAIRALKKNGGWIWSTAQRRAYHRGRLPRSQIDELEKIPGWTWHRPSSTRKSFPLSLSALQLQGFDAKRCWPRPRRVLRPKLRRPR